MENWLKNIEDRTFKAGSDFPALWNDFDQHISEAIGLSDDSAENLLIWRVLLLSFVHYDRFSALTALPIMNTLADLPSEDRLYIHNDALRQKSKSDRFVYDILEKYNRYQTDVKAFVNHLIAKHFERSIMKKAKTENPVFSFLDAKINGKRKTMSADEMKYAGFASMTKKKKKTFKPLFEKRNRVSQ